MIVNIEIIILIDHGTTHLFISSSFAYKLVKYVKPISLGEMLIVSTPMKDSLLIEYVGRDCKLKVGERNKQTNLIL